MIFENLKKDPFDFFNGRKDPCSLYAGKKWINKNAAEAADKTDKYAVEVLKNQLRDGSWENSPLSTLKMMFFLHLTKRESGDYSKNALSYLSSFFDSSFNINADFKLTENYFNDMPFLFSSFRLFFPCALIFTSSVFGCSDSDFYKSLFIKNREVLMALPEPAALADKYNYLRSALVDPVFKTDSLAMVFVKDLKEFFESENRPARLPDSDLFQIFNVLAHSSSPDAVSAVEKILPLVIERQNRDGSWGRGDCAPLSTFLVVHGLKNMAL